MRHRPHKNLAIEAQKREVAKVKRSENGVILDPVTLTPDVRMTRMQELLEERRSWASKPDSPERGLALKAIAISLHQLGQAGNQPPDTA